ncbi:MAG: hypothetical protein WDM71_00940 [Ferruginibacter sp.]
MKLIVSGGLQWVTGVLLKLAVTPAVIIIFFCNEVAEQALLFVIFNVAI